MHASVLLLTILFMTTCWLGRTSAALPRCEMYNPIRMTTQKTFTWKGYKNLIRQPGSANFGKDTFHFQSSPGSFILDVSSAPTMKNVFVIVPKRGKGDDQLYWVNNFTKCQAFWNVKQEDIGAVAIIHVAS